MEACSPKCVSVGSSSTSRGCSCAPRLLPGVDVADDRKTPDQKYERQGQGDASQRRLLQRVLKHSPAVPASVHELWKRAGMMIAASNGASYTQFWEQGDPKASR
jgi:hypothetical protein